MECHGLFGPEDLPLAPGAVVHHLLGEEGTVLGLVLILGQPMSVDDVLQAGGVLVIFVSANLTGILAVIGPTTDLSCQGGIEAGRGDD